MRIVKRKYKYRHFLGNRVTILITAAVIVSIAIALRFTLFAAQPGVGDGEIVATINGEPLTYGEFRLLLADNRSKVSGYFQAKYGDANGKDFWTANYDGEVPADKLKQAALTAAVNVKVPQLLAKQRAIVSDISYAAFVSGWKTENNNRAKAKENNQPIYGPLRYNEADYYRLVNSNLIGELRSTAYGEGQASDDELKQYYETRKEKLFSLPDTVTIQKLTIRTADAEQALTELQTKLADGISLQEALASYGEQAETKTQVFDSASAHSDTLANPELYGALKSLRKGQASDIFQEDGTYWIATCVDRKPGGYVDFGEVKESLRKDLAGQSFDRKVEGLIRSAAVDIRHEVYDRIEVD